MSGLLYFINTSSKTVTNKDLEGAGLSCFIDRVEDQRPTSGLGGGIVFTVQGKYFADDVGYYEDKQTWVEFDGFQVCYQPLDNNNQLLKDDFLNGHEVTLDDGNAWTIPLARKMPEGNSALPKKLREIREGEVVEVPIEKYLYLSKLADEAWAAFDENPATKTKYDFEGEGISEVYKDCKTLIMSNYDLEWFDISAMGLISRVNSIAVLWALVDFLAVEEKKTEE